MSNDWSKAISILKRGGVIVAPTDTLYGILAKATNKKTVERIYKIKGRDEDKPFIVLISTFNDLNKFGIRLTADQGKILDTLWPGKISVILSCTSLKFKYLHRGTKTIAFRMIGKRNPNLYHLIKKVGPVVAPSANLQGGKPAKNVWQAKKYFGNTVDMYMCGHTKTSKPSTLVQFKNNKLVVLREGAVKI
ncbi:MAG: L-threonylcarbamoyladenylate synthase [Patescibacteria group bacterium]